MAKVSCILRHWDVQMILAFSWARLAILVGGKSRGESFYFFPFIPVHLSSLTLSFISSTISSISFLPFSGRQHKMTHKGRLVVKPQHNQSINDFDRNVSYSKIISLNPGSITGRTRSDYVALLSCL